MIVQGRANPLVPYAGSSVAPSRFNRRGVVMSAPDTATFFAKLDNCSIPRTMVPMPDTNPNDGANATGLTYSGGTNGAEVALITVQGGGQRLAGRRPVPAGAGGGMCAGTSRPAR